MLKTVETFWKVWAPPQTPLREIYLFIYYTVYIARRTLSHSQSEESQVRGGHNSQVSVGKAGCKVQFLIAT